MAKKVKDLGYYIEEIERRKVVFEDKGKFVGWVFEYACRKIEEKDMNPRDFPGLIELYISNRMENVLYVSKKLYQEYPYVSRFLMKTPPENYIDEILLRERRRQC